MKEENREGDAGTFKSFFTLFLFLFFQLFFSFEKEIAVKSFFSHFLV